MRRANFGAPPHQPQNIAKVTTSSVVSTGGFDPLSSTAKLGIFIGANH